MDFALNSKAFSPVQESEATRSRALMKPQVVHRGGQQSPVAARVPAPPTRRHNYVNNSITRWAGAALSRGTDASQAAPRRATATSPGCGAPRQGVWKTGPGAPALRPYSTPNPTNGLISRLPLNSVAAGGREQRRPAPSCRSPEPTRREETAAAEPRGRLRFPGRGVPRNTHPSASSVSSTSPSIVGSGPGSGPLMVLRPKTVHRSKQPAGNRCDGAKVPVGVSTYTA